MMLLFIQKILVHILTICEFFRRLKENGVKMNPAKCNFVRKEVSFIGRVITGDGYKINSKKSVR